MHWTSDINCELPIKMAEKGLASEVKPDIIPMQMIRTAAMRGDAPSMRVMRNNREYMWTWNEYYNDILSFAKGLAHLGIDERKAINIMGFNAPEWAIAFYGSVFHNNVVSGVYITNGPAACQYQAHHSEAQVIVVDTEE